MIGQGMHLARALRRIALVAVAVVAAAALGCTPTPGFSPEEQAIRSTIERYNSALADGYRALNMSRMKEVATKLQSEDEYIHMSSLAEGGIRLDSELMDLKFIKMSIETTSAQVETRETWDYRHYSRQTGELVLEQKSLVYDLAYDLEKQADDGWLVSDVRAISATTTMEPTITGTLTPSTPSGH